MVFADQDLDNSKASNGDVLPEIGLMKSSSPDLPIEELRRRYEEDGYLWMKDILDKEKVLGMREQYFRFMTENGDSGILKQGTNPREGIFSGEDWRQLLLPGAIRVANGLKYEGICVEKTLTAHVADFYSKFKSNMAVSLESFVEKLAQFQDPMLLKRTLPQCNVPGGETTPVHYDQIYLLAGPPTSATAWIPLNDCALTGGGLMHLENSVEIGKRFEADFSEKKQAVRLATDLRFVDKTEPFDERWLFEAYQEADPNVASRQPLGSEKKTHM
ncbi:hypothetical protein N7481_003742 [Penicillium waksmanii]|uniref:uncharacterized protein n=1 Tax=Penicillium waksmanii TaxID=69791 RepID=UPI002549BD44|nr:uncharacterized protein N7481_003742 [Penicillium waksmanii]KAJ5988532.1 hypothetical protein N7481_003742 [Penicillium waksmanii]